MLRKFECKWLPQHNINRFIVVYDKRSTKPERKVISILAKARNYTKWAVCQMEIMPSGLYAKWTAPTVWSGKRITEAVHFGTKQKYVYIQAVQIRFRLTKRFLFALTENALKARLHVTVKCRHLMTEVAFPIVLHCVQFFCRHFSTRETKHIDYDVKIHVTSCSVI